MRKSLALKVHSTINKHIHGILIEHWLLGKGGIDNKSIPILAIDYLLKFEEAIVKEIRNDELVENEVYHWLEEFVDEHLNWHLQKIGEPADDSDNKISWKVNVTLAKIKVGIKEVHLRSSSVWVSLDRKPVIKKRILHIYVDNEAIFDGPEEDVETLEVKIPLSNCSPVHHHASLGLIDRELGSRSVDSKTREADILNLEESKEQPDLCGNHWWKPVIHQVWELIEEFFLDQIEERLLNAELHPRVCLQVWG